ncbi:hypothetical protein LCGC14_1579630 [marine sediment metagenome]|uniref:Big-1 domain-containing protein n=1 Tax=marine sediment metagenome TaxID=412755 RepID=A0A0F9J3D4_9ZZZZ
MINKTKITIVSSLCFIFIMGFFAQTNFIISSQPEFNDDTKTPNTSDASFIYDLTDGNSMNLQSTGNTVTNTLTSDSGIKFDLETQFNEGASGNAKTIINNTKEIYSDNNNKTYLRDSVSGFNATIDNGFNPHAVDVQTYDLHHDGYSNVSATAIVSDIDKDSLESFEISDTGDYPWDITYLKQITGRENLIVNNEVFIEQDVDYFKVIVGLDGFIVWSDGQIYYTWDGGSGWNPIPGLNATTDQFISIQYGALSLVLVNNTFIITDLFFWEITIVFWTDVYIYSLFYFFEIVWIYTLTITIYWGYWLYIFYLWVVFDLIYVFIYPDYDWKIEYYYTYIVIVWLNIEITIWYYFWYVHWVIVFWWEWWIFEIQWWYYYIDFTWIFIDFFVWIQFWYLYYNWIYIYYIPVYILPNLLDIDIIGAEYANTTFYFTAEVKDCWGNPISGAALTGTWDGSSIGTVTDNGDGTYSFTVSAITVNPGDPGLWLNLTASKSGYALGYLDTEIAVNPTQMQSKLYINNVKAVYTNTTFTFKLELHDSLGNLVSGATIGGTWDGSSIGSVTDNGDGTYSFSVAANLVNPGDPGIWLNLTSTKTGFIGGTLDSEIAVDPDAVNKQSTPIVDESPFIPGPSILLIGVVSSFSIIVVAKYLTKKRKIIKQ